MNTKYVIAKVRELVAKYPDFVYQGVDGDTCSNTEGGDPRYPDLCGCLIGQALRALGVDVSANEYADIETLGERGLVEGDTVWLRDVQSRQDSGDRWSECVAAADDRHPVTVTADELLAEVKKLASEMPDFVYQNGEGCSNVVGGDSKYPDHCGCIIGQALRRLGVRLPERLSASSVGVLSVEGIIEGPTFELSRIQRRQDSGTPWKDCI